MLKLNIGFEVFSYFQYPLKTLKTGMPTRKLGGLARYIVYLATTVLDKLLQSFLYMLNPQPALGVIGNIAFPLSRIKGKFISPPFTEVEFTRSTPVAQ